MLSNYYTIEYEGQSAILGWWVDVTEIKSTSEELKTKFDELARFRHMAIGRELKMIELKKEIKLVAGPQWHCALAHQSVKGQVEAVAAGTSV